MKGEKNEIMEVYNNHKQGMHYNAGGMECF